MSPPCICARIKEACNLPSLRINRGQVGTFQAIVAKAGVCKVLPYCFATMPFGDYMIHLMRNECRVIRYSAILAAIPRASDNFTAQCYRNTCFALAPGKLVDVESVEDWPLALSARA